jgi:hypothetical protein
MNGPSSTLVKEAAVEWLEAARAGVVRTRSGEPYKPSAIRGYEATLRRTILPELGNLRLSALTRARIQDLIDRLVARGLAPSTFANAILPLRAIYRRAVDREEVAVNPTQRLALPKDRVARDRVAEPREVDALLRVLPRAPLERASAHEAASLKGNSARWRRLLSRYARAFPPAARSLARGRCVPHRPMRSLIWDAHRWMG